MEKPWGEEMSALELAREMCDASHVPFGNAQKAVDGATRDQLVRWRDLAAAIEATESCAADRIMATALRREIECEAFNRWRHQLND